MSVIFHNFKWSQPGIQPGNYTLIAGTKAPSFGAGNAAYPPAGWTGLFNNTADDAYLGNITLPFTFYIGGVGYNTLFIESNAYVTYSAGSNNFNGLTSANPALSKIFIGASDNSYQRVSNFTYNTDFYRFRFEGTASTSGTPGNPNIVYEVTHFNPEVTGGNNVVEILVGKHARGTSSSGLFGVANTTTYYATGTLVANQSYVIIGSANGINHTIYSGYHMAGTNY